MPASLYKEGNLKLKLDIIQKKSGINSIPEGNFPSKASEREDFEMK